jgi:hypothetical protein
MTAKNDDDLGDLFRPVSYDAALETAETITPRKLKIDGRRRMVAKMKKEKAVDLLEGLPQPGEFIHLVSNGSFDYWSLCPIMLEMLGARGATVYASTWTLNRPNALEMLQMLDDGRIGQFHLLTGTYFKRRESAVFATIANGLLARGQKNPVPRKPRKGPSHQRPPGELSRHGGIGKFHRQPADRTKPDRQFTRTL